MKKVVLKLDFHGDRGKQEVMKAVSTLAGIESIALDTKAKKLTVVGDVDPVYIVSKLRKLCHTEIVSVGPAKEPEKKEDGKKDEPKKDQPKKKEDKKDGPDQIAELVKAYKAYKPYKPNLTKQSNGQSADENPTACVVC